MSTTGDSPQRVAVIIPCFNDGPLVREAVESVVEDEPIEIVVVDDASTDRTTVALLDEANRISSEPLVCDQVECHPFLNQDKVVAACRKHKMAVVAYSPIARGGAKGDKVLEKIGKAHGKSAAQISLRWLVQQGIVVIPRTSKVERLEENFALFDFALSDAEMREIAVLARRGGRIVDWTWSPNWD